MNKNLDEIKQAINLIKSNADEVLQYITNEQIKLITKNLKLNTVTFYSWFKNDSETESRTRVDTSVDDLLDLDTNEVTDLLTAFGNKERFKILTLLMKKSQTANEIVKKLNFKTTGKAYHHLNALIESKLIYKDEKDKYKFRAVHMGAFLALLSGCYMYISKQKSGKVFVEKL